MNCLIRNNCENEFLCCYFCKMKKCKDRCVDNCKSCKYFDGVAPKRGRPKKEDNK